MFHHPFTVADVLRSRIVSSPLHVCDSEVVSASGGAVVGASADQARDLPQPPVEASAPAKVSHT